MYQENSLHRTLYLYNTTPHAPSRREQKVARVFHDNIQDKGGRMYRLILKKSVGFHFVQRQTRYSTYVEV